MKIALKTVFVLALATAFTLGLGLVIAPDAEAGVSCPTCYIWDGAPGWSQYGTCIGGPSHCPAYYRTYINDTTGQICRGQFSIANV